MSRLHALLIFGAAACGSNNATPDAAKQIDAAKAFDAKVWMDAPIEPIDAPLVDAAPHPDGAPAMGTMHHYVASQEATPTNNTEARADGLDLNGDSVVDNQFGMVIATFAGMGLTSQAGVDTAISHGTTIILAALQTDDFTTATGAGFATYPGANPMPAPCNGSTDTVCGHHLTGSGTFDIMTGATIESPLVGNFVSGSMTTSIPGGYLTVPLAFGTVGFTADLIGARVQITGASATGLTAILAGGLSDAEMDAKVYPAVQVYVTSLVAQDCTMLMSPPTCGCTAGSNGKTMLELFDTNADCKVTTAEVKANQLFHSLFAPDITVNGQMALSVGVKITAVAATFTGP